MQRRVPSPALRGGGSGWGQFRAFHSIASLVYSVSKQLPAKALVDTRLSFNGFLLRALFSLLLVLLTFNPSGYSYVHLVADGFPHITPIEAVCGILLLIGWFVFLSATLRSIGLLGMLLAFALFAALIWLIVSWGWVKLANTHAIMWIALVILALILAIGMSWSSLYQRWSGQATVDDVDGGR